MISIFRDLNLVDQPECRTNRLYYADTIEFVPNPKRLNISILRRKYLEEGQSSQQIADEIGVSKQMVLSRLRSDGISRGPDRRGNPENYRFAQPPYGLRVKNQKLVTNYQELRIARLIVELRDREGLSVKDVVDELLRKGLFTRHGKIWSRCTVESVYKRWKGKL